ncbi:hypothetical protein [Streptomyces sp. NPDC060022]|uniref:hypothetical protein n=1 Tax=Streptomyces sp. NPDC060022 TaxID=3347039 RepID=UPI00367BA71D
METGGDGAVGASWPALEKVVESGNIRERFAFFYLARENKLLEDLLGPSPYPEALMAERKDRLTRTEEEQERNLRWASGGGPWPPEDVQPPLSDAERRQLAATSERWVAGSDLFEMALRSPFQKRASSTGALVASGTSGTTYSLMRFALKMRDQWGTDVDLAALRLLMIGGMVPGRHHTAHEVMLGAQLVFDEIAAEGTAVPEELNYRDGWSRYWHIAPLTEQELRGLSPDGRLPDEYALGLTPVRRTEEAGRPEGAIAERAELTSVEVTSPDTSYAKGTSPEGTSHEVASTEATSAARLKRVISTFGANQNGAQDLVHVEPVPEQTVVWLQEQVFQEVEQGRPEDPAFRDAVRNTITSQFLTSEWARLFSAHGLPIRAPYRGEAYQVALRLGLSSATEASPEIDEMPDGPPVNIQRWVFGVSEAGNTASIGDLRSMNLAYAHTWPVEDRGTLRRVTLTPKLSLTHNQVTTSVTTGATVQPMILLRSRERSWPYSYAMKWHIRATRDLTDAITTVPPEHLWSTPADSTPDRLTVWFPKHLIEDEADPATVTDSDPAKRPAQMTALLNEVPLFATETVPRADELFADILSSFKELSQISESSLEELRQFFSEGTLRGNLPLMSGGKHSSPTLFSKSGAVLGMLRVTVGITQRQGPDAIAGPPTRNSVLESHVLRSVEVSGSAAVENAAGLGIDVTAGFVPGTSQPDGDRTTPYGGGLGAGGAVQYQVAHTLNSGGSSRTSHSLRTAKPLLSVRGEAVYTITLVSPDGPELEPSADSPLGTGTAYPLILRVPSAATVTGAPGTPRYLPPEVLHLRSLNVSTTPLAVHVPDQLFKDVEDWLRANGFLPPEAARLGLGNLGPAERAAQVKRLTNLRKLDQIRSVMGLRAELDEMIEGGHVIWFERPGIGGTQRVSLRISAQRRYLEDEDGGITHDQHLTDIQTLNYTGSTIPGTEQLTRTPAAYSGTVHAAAGNPTRDRGDLWLKGVGGEYTRSWQRAFASKAGVGSGHEFYALSPTANGIQVYTLPVTYRTEMSWSHGPVPELREHEGTVRLALPTYRTETERSTRALPSVPSPLPVTEAADGNEPEGAVRLPETAWLDRVMGSHDIRQAVNEMLVGFARAAVVEQEQEAVKDEGADGQDEPSMPGAWLADTEPELKEKSEPTDTESEPTDIESEPTDTESEPTDTKPELTAERTGEDEQEGQGEEQLTQGPNARGIQALLRGATDAVRWTFAQTAAIWKSGKRFAVGGEPAAPESMAREVLESGLSPHHMAGNGLRIFRDSYVLEGISTSGVLVGTDVAVEVQGFLTDLKALPRPGVMDYERWIQSVDASSRTTNTTHGNAAGLMIDSDYGNDQRTFVPSGGYTHRRNVTDGYTVSDASGGFRVTSENDIPAHRYSGTATYVVTVKTALRNVVVGTVSTGGAREDTRVITIPDAVEFLLSDNDLINHPEFVLDGVPEAPAPGPRDRTLPSYFVQSGGQIGFGSVVEVHPEAERSAFQKRIRELVENVAPGSTVPGHSTYLPGVLSRINEHGSPLGMQVLVNAGPTGQALFHFVYRSWLGPMLVEVALNARPVEDLGAARGRSALRNAGLDTVLGRISGDGSALPVPGTTEQTHTTSAANEVGFSPRVKYQGNEFSPALSMARQTGVTETATSTRERRAWERSMLDTSEFSLGYTYSVTVRSAPMEHLLTVIAAKSLADGLSWMGQHSGLTHLAGGAYQLLPAETRDRARSLIDRLPRVAQEESSKLAANVVLRFNGAETPAESASPRRRITPALYTDDPTNAVTQEPGETVIDMEIPAHMRELLSDQPWRPSRPFAVYDYNGVAQLIDALRAVDPVLGRDPALRTSTSAEGMFLRLAQLAATGRLTLLSSAATAPYVGQTGPAGTSIQLAIHAPRSESDSLDTAIDRVEITTDGSSSRADLTMTSALNFGSNIPLNSAQTDRLSQTAPFGGGSVAEGQAHTLSSPRREMLRFGTAMAGAERGARSYQVWAVGLLKVVGPRGTRWVAANIVLRTTEAPPTEPEVTNAAPDVDVQQEVKEPVTDVPVVTDVPPVTDVPQEEDPSLAEDTDDSEDQTEEEEDEEGTGGEQVEAAAPDVVTDVPAGDGTVSGPPVAGPPRSGPPVASPPRSGPPPSVGDWVMAALTGASVEHALTPQDDVGELATIDEWATFSAIPGARRSAGVRGIDRAVDALRRAGNQADQAQRTLDVIVAWQVSADADDQWQDMVRSLRERVQAILDERVKAREIRSRFQQLLDERRLMAAALRDDGSDEEEIARSIVEMRNDAKDFSRVGMSAEEIALLEARNMLKYGNPTGPTVGQQYNRFGSLAKVIEVATRGDDAIDQERGTEPRS